DRNRGLDAPRRRHRPAAQRREPGGVMALRLWRTIVRGTRALANPGAADAEADEESRHFLDESAADLESRGLSAADARRAARTAWGHPIAMREQVRGSGWEHLVATAATDVRHAARRLRRTPGFTLVAVSTLALGIGASTAIFSAVNPILIANLPYPESHRVVAVLENGNGDRGTFAMYRTLAPRTHASEAISVARRWLPAMTGADAPERLEGQRVSAAYFDVLGVAPAIGRGFTADEDRPGGAPVTVLSDALWRRRFAADGSIIGRTIRLNDTPFTVVGVMPAGFENVVAPAAEIWTSLQYDPPLPPNGRQSRHHLLTVARLRPPPGRAVGGGSRVGGGLAGGRGGGPGVARRARACLLRSGDALLGRAAARRARPRCAAGPARHRRRRTARARHRVRERDEPAARARRRTARRVRAPRRAWRGPRPPRASDAHRERAARRDGRRGRCRARRSRGPRAGGDRASGPAARRRHPRRWPGAGVRVRRRDARGPRVRIVAGARRGRHRSASRHPGRVAPNDG